MDNKKDAKWQKRKNLRYTLTKTWSVLIIVYYVLLLILGITGSIIILSNLEYYLKANLLLTTILCSIGMTCAFCSIQYLQLIYKACIDKRIDIIKKNDNPRDDFSEQILGNVLYFILRPLFAIVFVIIAVFSLLGGFILITSSMDYIINDRFFYFSVIISCIIGFSIGNLLDKFDAFSRFKISQKLNISEEGNNNETEDDNEKR
ncbi:MAG: hypothetical protein K2I30_05010 [Clostridia bacterium]|nr:hypothetical protein [Clostridia bacterium]